MRTLTYDPTQFEISLAGLYKLEGFADGTFVEIIKNAKPFQYQTSLGDEVGRVFIQDNTYTVNVTLAQSSLSNNILSALHSLDIATRGNAKFPILVQDKSGTTKFFSTNAWVETYPNAQFGKSVETRTWTIQCSNGVYSLGGNDAGTTAMIASLVALAPAVSDILGGP